MTKLIRYSAPPVKDGEWLGDLNGLMSSIGDEIVANDFYVMQHDTVVFRCGRYNARGAETFSIRRSITSRRTAGPTKRGAGYAAELSIAKNSSDTMPTQ